MLKLKKLFVEQYSNNIEYDLYIPFDLKVTYSKIGSERFYMMGNNVNSILEIYTDIYTGKVTSITLVAPNRSRTGKIKLADDIIFLDKVPGLAVDDYKDVEVIEENGWGYVRITNEFEVILDKSSILVEFQNAKKDRVATKMKNVILVFDEELRLSKIIIREIKERDIEILKKSLRI